MNKQKTIKIKKCACCKKVLIDSGHLKYCIHCRMYVTEVNAVIARLKHRVKELNNTLYGQSKGANYRTRFSNETNRNKIISRVVGKHTRHMICDMLDETIQSFKDHENISDDEMIKYLEGYIKFKKSEV